MAVYVDDFYVTGVKFGRMKMSHMCADSTEELLAMADKINLARKWIQCEGEGKEHFDVAMSTRKKAIAAGAIPKPMRELAKLVVARKSPNEKLLFTEPDQQEELKLI